MNLLTENGNLNIHPIRSEPDPRNLCDAYNEYFLTVGIDILANYGHLAHYLHVQARIKIVKRLFSSYTGQEMKRCIPIDRQVNRNTLFC